LLIHLLHEDFSFIFLTYIRAVNIKGVPCDIFSKYAIPVEMPAVA